MSVSHYTPALLQEPSLTRMTLQECGDDKPWVSLVRNDAPAVDAPGGQIRNGIVDLIEGIALGHQRIQVELAAFIPADEDGEIAVWATQAAACPGVGALSDAIGTIDTASNGTLPSMVGAGHSGCQVTVILSASSASRFSSSVACCTPSRTRAQ